MARVSGAIHFANINFGQAAAEDEKSDNRLMTEGFFDAFGYVDQIINGDKFLILGPKGSGKSAIGTRIEYISEQHIKSSRYDLFAQLYPLKGFPFNSFSELLPITESLETKFPDNWEFLLLIALLDSFSKDNVSDTIDGDIKIEQMIKALKESTIIPNNTLTDIVKKITRKEFRIQFPKILSYDQSSEKTENVKERKDINYLWQQMREICYSAKCSAKHIIIIDDIDWVLYRNERQYKALAALIQAAYEMNRTLRDNEVNAKIVVLCRTDLFEKLEGPNLNKAKQFGGLIIDWYQKTTDIYSTNLVHLLNKRAEATLGQKVDVYKLMPRTLHHPTPMLKTLIEYTRHTPRDLIHVMKYIQAYTTDGNPDILEIKDGIKKYSEVYLIQEIHDEISSYLTNEEIDNIFSVFATMKKSRFSINELTQFTCKYPDDSVQSMDIMRVLKALFDSGAIGNISRVKGYGDFVTFKHRNRNALFNPTEDIMIHRGLEKGLRLLPNHEK